MQRRSGSELQTLGRRVEAELQSENLQAVVHILSPQPALTKRVLYLLRKGALEDKKDMDGNGRDKLTESLPSSCNKWNYLSKERLEVVVEELSRKGPDRSVTGNTSKNKVLKMVCCALATSETSALPTKTNLKDLIESVKSRYEEMGSLFPKFEYTSSVQEGVLVNYVKSGLYRLSPDGGPYVSIKYNRTGEEVKLPSPLPKSYEIMDNHLDEQAKLRSPEELATYLVADVFQRANKQVIRPLHEAVVSKPGQKSKGPDVIVTPPSKIRRALASPAGSEVANTGNPWQWQPTGHWQCQSAKSTSDTHTHTPLRG